jgi:hypothetical protein
VETATGSLGTMSSLLTGGNFTRENNIVVTIPVQLQKVLRGNQHLGFSSCDNKINLMFNMLSLCYIFIFSVSIVYCGTAQDASAVEHSGLWKQAIQFLVDKYYTISLFLPVFIIIVVSQMIKEYVYKVDCSECQS